MGLQLLPEFSNWSSIMIGPCGLLLVVSHLLFAAVVLWVGLEKSKELNLDVRNIFAGSDTGDALLRQLAKLCITRRSFLVVAFFFFFFFIFFFI
jgi:hypothetical protein